MTFKTLFLSLLASALLLQSAPALSSSELHNLILWANSAGFFYLGARQVPVLDSSGHSIVEQLYLFSRPTDNAMAVVQLSAPSLKDAENQFIGSTYLSHYLNHNK